METNSELIASLTALSAGLPAPLQRDLRMIVHKATYPMRDILAQVPGDSLTDRAKKLRVSRQTMYVWASEKFRPTRVQAKRIARVTGVPIEHILDDGFEVGNDTGTKARKKAPRMAARRKEVAKRDRSAAPKRRSASVTRKRTRAAE
jgi:DNA-binding XRE family transcriptional regulator